MSCPCDSCSELIYVKVFFGFYVVKCKKLNHVLENGEAMLYHSKRCGK
jgi:hypothetical protein